MAFETFGPAIPRSPVIISVPHAGRDYPAEMDALARVGAATLRPLEDRFADHLARIAIKQGHSAIIARTARAWIDLNRAETEFDPGLIRGSKHVPLLSSKVRGGLGIIPRRIARVGDIWRGAITAEAFEARLAAYHRPYHAALSQMIDVALRAFGTVFLLDLHSMPPLRARDDEVVPQIVIGDLFGRSAMPRYTHGVATIAEQAGFIVGTNAPYAGGHILERHSHPARGIHAFQIEIDRSLYLDAASDQPGAGLAVTQKLIADIAAMLDQEITALPLPIAAE